MEHLSGLMLVLIAMLLCVAVPRMYGDWLSLRERHVEGGAEELQRLLGTQNLWVQRHFWCAAVAIAMVLLIDQVLSSRADQLARVTAVYAGISLTLAFLDSLLAQRAAALLVVSRRNRRVGGRRFPGEYQG